MTQRPAGITVPGEGTDRLYSQTWSPVCLSSEVPAGAVVGRDYLGSRVVAWRDAGGVAHVQSAYCAHLGADLAAGKVVGNELRCAFHHWDYAGDGRVVRTGSGDPVPPGACVWGFPTLERWGLVWAFNGERPLFDLPGFDAPESDLHWKTVVMQEHYGLDPWVFLCNTLDFNHLKVVHRLRFEHDDPDQDIAWTPYSVRYRLKGTRLDTGDVTDYRLGIVGTNIFWLTGTINGLPMHFMMPFRTKAPSSSCAYGIVATDRRGVAAERADELLERFLAFERAILAEDQPIMSTIRFRVGALTRSDRNLARFLEHLRAFPRANPARDFLD